MGLVNAVVRSPSSSARRRLVPRDDVALPPGAAAAEVELQRRRGRAHGLQQLSHDATLLFYMTEEGQEGRNAYKEGRRPDFSKFPKRP